MLFVGNDWAEDHHDVEIVDERGRRLARRRLPEGLDGITRLHALIAQFFPEEGIDPAEVPGCMTEELLPGDPVCRLFADAVEGQERREAGVAMLGSDERGELVIFSHAASLRVTSYKWQVTSGDGWKVQGAR